MRICINQWFGLLVWLLCLPSLAVDVSTVSNSLNIQLTTPQLSAGEMGKLSLSISSQPDGGAVSGLHPAVWIRPRLEERSTCKDAVRNYLQMGANAARDMDLNGYHFITLNQDHSIGVMNPQVNLASANLLALHQGKQAVNGWHLDTASGKLYITRDASTTLFVLNAFDGKVLEEIALPVIPTRLLPDPQQQQLWIVSEHALHVFSLRTLTVIKSLPLRTTQPLLELSDTQEQLWIYDGKHGELSSIDTVSLTLKWQLPLPLDLISMAYSAHAHRLYLGKSDQAEIISLYPESDAKPITITSLSPAVPQALSVTPDGQWLFAQDHQRQQVVLINTATQRPQHRLEFNHTFDQIVFSKRFAYVHHITSPKMSLIQLDALTEDISPSLLEIAFGAKPPGKQTNALPLIANLPKGGAVIVSNPADKALFLYMENGMFAPSNVFKVYTAAPTAVLIHDKALTETQVGRYEATTLIPKPGEYEVVTYLNNPVAVSCLPLTVAGSGTSIETTLRSPITAIQVQAAQHRAGIATTLKVNLHSDAPLMTDADVQILLFKPGTNWQKRLALPMNTAQSLTIPVTFPEAGQYLLAVQSTALQLDFSQQHMQTLEVIP